MKITFHIPHAEISDFASLLDAVKKEIVTMNLELNNQMFTHGPVNSVSITVRPPSFDENMPKDVFIVDVKYDPIYPRNAVM